MVAIICRVRYLCSHRKVHFFFFFCDLAQTDPSHPERLAMKAARLVAIALALLVALQLAESACPGTDLSRATSRARFFFLCVCVLCPADGVVAGASRW